MSPEEITLTIDDLSRGGSGLGRDESGRVVFVPFTAPGDRVSVRLYPGRKRNWVEGELLSVLDSSPQREAAACRVFGQCGGCQWQHIPYPRQWETKAGGVRHALARAGLEVPESWEEFPALQALGYRNRIQLRGWGNKLGYYKKRSHDLVDIESCAVAHPEINAALPAVREEGAALKGEWKVELEALPGGGVRRVWNEPHGSRGFRQVNDEQNVRLRSWVKSKITAGAQVLDLFGGDGNLSRELSVSSPRIDVVDLGTPWKRKPEDPQNMFFHRSGVVPWLKQKMPGVLESGVSCEAILDPARDGLDHDLAPIETALAGAGVKRLVLVGCQPDNWARDLAGFQRRGWKLEAAGCLDFFPQTPHVESVACLRR